MIGGLRRPAARLFMTSAIVLYAELLLIRWIPANLTYVAFFSNLVLMASFLGIGLGILLGRRYAEPRIPPFAPLLVATVLVVLVAKLDVRPLVEGSVLAELAERHAADPNYVVLPIIFSLVAAVLASLALPLGPLLRAMPPLRAYAIDIGGSIVGIVAFTTVSVLGAPPPVWFGILGVGLAVRGAGTLGPRALVGAASIAFAVALTAVAQDVSGDIWSPYYRISMFFPPNGTAWLAVNGIPHQNFYALDAPKREAFYDQVYRWFPERRFARVLIIGAGNGTDVDGALAHGAEQVDAVEIDPRILALGERYHPDRPYADPRVRTVVDDGRAELRRTDRTYDLIIFALTDSLTLSSTAADLRLESFLYTEEALAGARDHLAPDGVMLIYNYYDRPFLVAKLAGMLEQAFGAPPIVRTYEGGRNVGAAFAAGGGVRSATAFGDRADRIAPIDAPRPATDDWPFLYLEAPTIAGYYLVVLGAVLVLSALAVAAATRAAGTRIARASPHFFVLGAAFLLLETKSLATFSLLFGSTWFVNALVFAAILVSVVAAIGVTARAPLPRLVPYVLLGASLVLLYLVPPASLLFDPPPLRYLVASALAFAPVFFGNLVFTASFRDTRTADMAFASNVVGAVLGGCLEYVALMTGYRELVLVIAALYVLALVFARTGLLGDRELAVAR